MSLPAGAVPSPLAPDSLVTAPTGTFVSRSVEPSLQGAGSDALAGVATPAGADTLAFVVFTLVPLLALVASTIGSIVYIRRLGEHYLLLAVAVLALMASHQTLEVYRFATGAGIATSLRLEAVETAANLLAAGTVFSLLAFALGERQTAARYAWEREQLTTIVDHIRDSVFLLDMEADRILRVNDAACEMLGYDRTELESRPVSDIHPDEMERMRQLAATARAEGDALASDLSCRTKDGGTVPVEVSMCATGDSEGDIVTIVRDISNRKHQSHFLSVFDRILRHNLRNAMNVVLGRAEYIEEHAEDERVADLAQSLSKTADGLVDVANDVRTVQRSIRPAAEPSIRTDCVPLIEAVASDLDAAYPDATVTTDLPDSLSVRADDRLEVAVRQLVENAIEHNDSPHPAVEIVATTVEDGCTEVRIIDDGPGIPEEERLVATNPEETSPLEHGTGLGLWVASMLARSFDGSVRFEENYPRGTVVVLRLPLDRRSSERSRPEQ